jgi:hypothetical protein
MREGGGKGSGGGWKSILGHFRAYGRGLKRGSGRGVELLFLDSWKLVDPPHPMTTEGRNPDSSSSKSNTGFPLPKGLRQVVPAKVLVEL